MYCLSLIHISTATGLVKPDLGVVLGCKKAKTLDEKDQSVGELGKGLLVSFYDKGMMPNRGLLDALVPVSYTHLKR